MARRKPKTKGGFASRKREKHYERQKAAQKKRWGTQAEPDDSPTDHSYPVKENEADISNLDHEETVFDGEKYTWSEGRRVIELDVLAQGLRACQKCGLHLQLENTIDIRTYGLSAILKITCSNLTCGHLNSVPTGKRHGKLWDANLKLASAAVNAGIGERQLNTLLSGLNIPTVSHTTFSARQRDVGLNFKEVAKESTDRALQEEIKLTKSNTDKEELTVSVDAGWQKRGSGRSYDSLSGHCSMIGAESGKVINYAVSMKACKICTTAENSNIPPPKHECHINWSGSAKAMEADMVEEMVKGVERDGAHVKSIVGDDDSTSIARLHANVNKSIKKLSDANHVKKHLGNSLYSLKKDFKKLTFKVIQYLQRCFAHILAQGRGNQVQIRNNIIALGQHPFGNHSLCSSSWCRFVENPKSKFKSLPGGKPLNDENLQKALCCVLETYANSADKLSSLGSSQSNESFNRLVASKAPKANHYSSSGSLSYRVAASVAQKNEGHKYIMKLNKRLGLSPGYFTERLARIRDLQHKKRKAVSGTYKFKQRRRFLKSKRKQNASTNEVREGTCYSTGCDLEGNADIDQIPSPTCLPEYKQLTTITTEVIFDIEATGLARTSHITQLSAIKGDDFFNTYIMPKKEMTPKAQQITGIKVVGKKMYHNDREVEAVPIKQGLESFLKFLSSPGNVVLCGHNIKSYDVPVLFYAMEACGLVEEFSSVIKGFMDILPLFKCVKPGLKSYSQTNLFNNLLEESYEAHDALQDVIALQRLLKHVNPSVTIRLDVSFTFDSTYTRFVHSHNSKLHERSLMKLHEADIISKRTVSLIACSGLSFKHLELAYSRDGREGIENILTEKFNGRPRVTKSRKIVDAISDFFHNSSSES